MAQYIAVPLKLSSRRSHVGPLGIVDELREAVLGARRAHPHLADRRLVDVSLKRRGDEVQVTLYFSA